MRVWFELSKPKAIVLRAAGTNCQMEAVYCISKAGFAVDVVHVSELVSRAKKLVDYDFLVVPGGFSCGDYLGAGKVFSNKIMFNLESEVKEFAASEKLVIGICNGFQVLVKTGLLPNLSGRTEQECTLAINDSGGFQCRWVELKALESKCVFTKGIDYLRAPIAHGEGRFYATQATIGKLFEKKMVPFTYVKNPNGSLGDIAGVCDKSGRIFGLMPHPERNNSQLNDPNSTEKNDLAGEGKGMKIFRNAREFFKR